MKGILVHADHDDRWCPGEPESLEMLATAIDAWWKDERAWQTASPAWSMLRWPLLEHVCAELRRPDD